jgi:hypothetical protein
MEFRFFFGLPSPPSDGLSRRLILYLIYKFKGIISSSIGVLLKAKNYRVTAIKIDPYINVDAGTFSPFEHG